MSHKVKCFYCGHIFDRDKEPFVAIPNKAKRYAHKKCFNTVFEKQQLEQEQKQELENYIKTLFNYTTLPEIVNKQITHFITEKNYTYSGILKSLKYFYEIKNGDKEKAYGRIGIVPFVYDDAHNYYLAIWQARQKNEKVATKIIEQYVLPTTEIHIPIPKREPMKKHKKLFTFLEEELSIEDE